MISWTSTGPGGQPPTAPGPLVVRPLDPLPPRVAVPTPPPERALPPTASAVVVTVLVAGSPWGYETITGWLDGLPRTDGPGAVVAALAEMVVIGLRWLRWQMRATDDDGYWLVENATVLVFVVATVWLLRRLAAGPVPSPTHRVLATLGAPLAGAAAASAATVVLLAVLFPDALDASGHLRALFYGGLYAGVVLGAPLALMAALRPAAPTDAPAIGDRR